MNKISLFFLIFINLILINKIFASKTDCNTAPPDLKKTCLTMKTVRKNNEENENEKKEDAKKGSRLKGKIRISVTQRPELNCVTQSCCCNYYGGTSNGSINDCTLQKAIRKELRMLTDEERVNMFNAFKAMYKRGDYAYLAQAHRDAVNAGSWHAGPSFALAHREFLKRCEIMLRKSDATVALPYWDPTIDSPLSTPADSILFTEMFLGSTDSKGYVVTGPFKDWKTLEGNPHISRNVSQEGRCLHKEDVEWILSQTKIENILSYTYPEKGCPFDVNWKVPELCHGRVHSFVAGDMLYLETSCNDPVFMFYHCFMDMLFQTWRQLHQTREQRATVYPKDIAACAPPAHFKDTEMYSFAPLRNCDALRNEYTDNMYEYAPRPTCTATTECESKSLFCDRSPASPRCVSKVRLGGDCRGFAKDADICYNSTCLNGICVEQMPTTPLTVLTTTTIPTKQTTNLISSTKEVATTMNGIEKDTSSTITNTDLITNTNSIEDKTTTYSIKNLIKSETSFTIVKDSKTTETTQNSPSETSFTIVKDSTTAQTSPKGMENDINSNLLNNSETNLATKSGQFSDSTTLSIKSETTSTSIETKISTEKIFNEAETSKNYKQITTSNTSKKVTKPELNKITTKNPKGCKNPPKSDYIAELRKKIRNFLKRITNQEPKEDC